MTKETEKAPMTRTQRRFLAKQRRKAEEEKEKESAQTQQLIDDVTAALELVNLVQADSLADTKKRLRTLTKKLRQIDQILERVKSGDVAELNDEQKKKVAGRDAIAMEKKACEKILETSL